MTLADAGRGGAPERPREQPGTWLGDELQRALARVDAVTRALEAVQGGLRLQQEEIALLSDVLQTVDGRTQRHESGQEIAHAVRQELAGMAAALEAEAALRRDLAARVERGDRRETETQHELQRVLEQVASRLDAFDGRQASITERAQRLTTEVAGRERAEQTVEERVAALERQAAAEGTGVARAGQEIARLGGAVPELLASLADLAGRLRAMQLDHGRLEEEVAALRAIRDREEALLDVLEQQRSTRARMEERLNSAEEALEVVRRAQAETAETLALIAREQAGETEQRRRLGERIEAQRDLVAEHLRRALRAEEESARRRIDEIEREMRVARALLVGLDEQAGTAEQEPPL